MDGESGTLKNVVFRKVKSGQIVARPRTTLQKLQENLFRQLQPKYLPKEAEIKEPKDRDTDSDPGHATNS